MVLRASLIVALLLTTACRGPKTPERSSSSRGLAEHRRAFLDGCAKKPVAGPDYCECAWDEFQKMFTEEEMNATDVEPGKLKQYQSAVIGACSSKIPEETVRAGYDRGCTSGNEELSSYCDCTWIELRKSFSAPELADPETARSPRFVKAKNAAVLACAEAMPESVVRKGFIKGCMKKSPDLETFCTCGWTELRKYVTPAQLQTGDYDEKTVFPKVEKACGKHRPK